MPINDDVLKHITDQTTLAGSVRVFLDALKSDVEANPNPDFEKQKATLRAVSGDEQKIAAALLANTNYAPPVII